MVNYAAGTLDLNTAQLITQHFMDITGAAHVEIIADRSGGTLHVNINGVCALRVCRIHELVVKTRGFRGVHHDE